MAPANSTRRIRSSIRSSRTTCAMRLAAATITISDAGGRVVRTLRGPAQRGTQSRDVGHVHGIRDGDPAADGARNAGRRAEAVVAAVAVAVGVEAAAVAAPVENADRSCCRANTRCRSRFPESRNRCVAAVTVEADPMDAAFTAAQRRDRQAMLLDVHALQRTLGEARRASRTLSGQTTAIRQALGRGGSAGTAKADALADRIERSSGRGRIA